MTDPEKVSTSDTDPKDPAPAGGDTPKDNPDTANTEPDHKAEAEKWKALARKHENQAKSNADAAKKLAELEDKDKSEEQRRDEALTSTQSENARLKAENRRLNVALDHAPEGMSLSKVKKLAKRLTGDTQEEIEADAKELFADFAPADTDDDPDKTKEPGKGQLPKERLKPGSVPGAEPEETDPTKLAAKVPRRY